MALGVVGIATLSSVVAAALTVRVARQVVTPPKTREEDIRVIAVSDKTITLTATKDSLLPGRYGLWFDQGEGYARVGAVVDATSTAVTRELISVDYGVLGQGARARLSGWFYLSPKELGYPYSDVEIATELGPAPAWLIPAEQPGDSWVIEVHGRAVRRSETLRAVEVFREAGYTSLLVSYRNDEDAPASADGRYSLGDSEWKDVDAALAYAVANGAKNVVLMGWSMGGAIVLQTATRSAHARFIRGIVLDSPVIDWASVLGFQGAEMRLPAVASKAVLAVIGNRWGKRLTGQHESIDLARLDFVARADELTWPILLMHSDDDGYVPSTSSHALAEARPDIVTFDAFSVARHTKLWNYDAGRWNVDIAAWLAALAPSAAATRERFRRG
ncbi:alpha/beta fold hydrolase [Conyzicola nivalis]|uniref:Alpha/beta hydrolase n=1 Tax=Conyzicola nivalis TaxID=1477021 RepID=A0A916WH16_9MICO|nr:alpha/beta fold hydrolase [Conyzicola nivalis]GGA96843.1 alpha/beta hydrolase [Conyzicola nivalis]